MGEPARKPTLPPPKPPPAQLRRMTPDDWACVEKGFGTIDFDKDWDPRKVRQAERNP